MDNDIFAGNSTASYSDKQRLGIFLIAGRLRCALREGSEITMVLERAAATALDHELDLLDFMSVVNCMTNRVSEQTIERCFKDVSAARWH